MSKGKEYIFSLIAIVASLGIVASACSHDNENGEGGENHGNESGEGIELAGRPNITGTGEFATGGDVASSPILSLDMSWDGVINGLRVSLAYDSNNSGVSTFSGTLTNTTTQSLCSILLELNLKQGSTTVDELGPLNVGDIQVGAAKKVSLSVPSGTPSFSSWQIHPEIAQCGGGPASTGEEGANQLPLSQAYDQTKNGARLQIKYIEATNTFEGTVTNTTNRVLTRVRVEVHLTDGTSGKVIAELGPTSPTDLAPGQSININLSADKVIGFVDWSPHVEVGNTEAGTSGGEGLESGEGGSEHGSSEGSEGRESGNG